MIIFGFDIRCFFCLLSVMIIIKILFCESKWWFFNMILLILLIFKLLIKILLYGILFLIFMFWLWNLMMFFFLIKKILLCFMLIFLVIFEWVFCILYLLFIGIKYFGLSRLIISFNFFCELWLDIWICFCVKMICVLVFVRRFIVLE